MNSALKASSSHIKLPLNKQGQLRHHISVHLIHFHAGSLGNELLDAVDSLKTEETNPEVSLSALRNNHCSV